jgi:hypothetical protein
MALRDRLLQPSDVATATVATLATVDRGEAANVAKVAEVAVANSEGTTGELTSDVLSPADERRKAVLDMLEQEPSTTHAFITDDLTESNCVIVTVGIRGIGTCDLRIPREKYDGLAVLKLIEEHTGLLHKCARSTSGLRFDHRT